MSNHLKRIFKPSIEEEIADLESIISIYGSLIGECCTCIHHEETSLPGYYTDYGRCEIKSECFSKKVSGLNKIPCSNYCEDIDFTKGIRNRIRELELLKDN